MLRSPMQRNNANNNNNSRVIANFSTNNRANTTTTTTTTAKKPTFTSCDTRRFSAINNSNTTTTMTTTAATTKASPSSPLLTDRTDINMQQQRINFSLQQSAQKNLAAQSPPRRPSTPHQRRGVNLQQEDDADGEPSTTNAKKQQAARNKKSNKKTVVPTKAEDNDEKEEEEEEEESLLTVKSLTQRPKEFAIGMKQLIVAGYLYQKSIRTQQQEAAAAAKQRRGSVGELRFIKSPPTSPKSGAVVGDTVVPSLELFSPSNPKDNKTLTMLVQDVDLLLFPPSNAAFVPQKPTYLMEQVAQQGIFQPSRYRPL